MKNTLTTFYLIRHGETEWNTKKLLQGHSDSPLTEEGKIKMLELAGKLAEIHFDHAFSSDLLRAKQTAEMLILNRQLAINTTRLLRERAYGQHEGRHRDEFRAKNKALIEQVGKLSRQEQMKFKYAEDIESDDEVVQRLLVFLREAAVAYEGKTILMVSHGGVLRCFLRHLGSSLANKDIGNASYIKFTSDGVEFNIQETSGLKTGKQIT